MINCHLNVSTFLSVFFRSCFFGCPQGLNFSFFFYDKTSGRTGRVCNVCRGYEVCCCSAICFKCEPFAVLSVIELFVHAMIKHIPSLNISSFIMCLQCV